MGSYKGEKKKKKKGSEIWIYLLKSREEGLKYEVNVDFPFLIEFETDWFCSIIHHFICPSTRANSSIKLLMALGK